ncbi:NfeD family protein [Desulfosarcina sp. OttesenSCG-928-G10]|nr:NfeD family protein [Desulfosarcina sp. OttesenSCG-928-G10]
MEFWHWFIFGAVLIMAEIFVPSFTIFWFGLGALVVGLITLAAKDISLAWQIFFWTLSSCIFTFLWFKYFRPKMIDRTKAGLSREAIVGEVGQVIHPSVAAQGQRGKVRFTIPLLGADEWAFICDTDTAAGDRVSVTDIAGNALVVRKL